MITTNKPFRKLVWIKHKDEDEEEEKMKEDKENNLDLKYNILTIGLDGYMSIYSIREMIKIGGAAIQSSPIWDIKKIRKNEQFDDEESILNTHDGVIMSFDNGICSIVFIPHENRYLNESSIRMLPMIILKSTSTYRILCTQYQWIKKDKKGMMISVYGGSMEGKLYRWDVEIPSMNELNYYKQINNPLLTIDLPKRSIPWCIEACYENEIIVGDSNGEVTVYDTNMGVQLQSLVHHKADILSMFIYENERLFTMGVDSSIVFYNRMIDEEGQSKWIYDSFIRPHTNDILTSSGTSSFLLTGGIDTKLFIHQLRERNDDYLLYKPSDHHVHPYHGHEIAKLSCDNESNQNRYMIVHLGKDLQLWRLGKYIINEYDDEYDYEDEVEDKEIGGGKIRRNANGFFIEQRNLILHIKTKKEINCFNISKGTNSISYSDSESTFLLFIDLINNNNDYDQQIVRKKIKLNNSSSCIEFSNDNSLFIRYTPSNNHIEIYDIDFNNYTIKLNHIIKNDPLSSSSSPLLSVKNIKCSDNGLFIAFYSYYSNSIYIYDIKKREYHYIIHDIDDNNIPLSFGFDNLSKKLFVITSSSKLFIYNIKKKRLSSWSDQYSSKLNQWIIKKVSSFNDSLFKGSFNPNNNNQLLLYGNNFILFIDTSKNNNNSKKKRWKLVKEYNPLFLDYIDEKSIVIIEKPWISILQKLPQPFYRKRFGT